MMTNRSIIHFQEGFVVEDFIRSSNEFEFTHT